MQRYLNKSLPLILPEAMQVSSIWHDSKRLRITAIKKRDWYERNEEYDTTIKSPKGKNVVLKGFEHEIVRSLVAFEWDLVLNEATLQIAQLPHGTEYSTVADEFFELTQDWIDRSLFTEMDLRRPIARLHELEEKGLGETRSQTINYRTMQGRRIEAKSASMADPLFGEQPIDTMLQAVRKKRPTSQTLGNQVVYMIFGKTVINQSVLLLHRQLGYLNLATLEAQRNLPLCEPSRPSRVRLLHQCDNCDW